MKFDVKENHSVWVEKHPYFQSLNEKLLEDATKFDFYTHLQNTEHTNVRGWQSNIEENKETPSLKIIRKWVTTLIVENSRKDLFTDHINGSKMWMWFARYEDGDYTQSHDHATYASYAFVYFVKAPRGASPLVFTTSGKKIKAEEGKVVIFPGTLKHHVPNNKCDDRMVIAGSIVFHQSK